MLDDGSFTGAPLAAPAFASNALLVGAKRSETGHPLFVAGPQVGYFFPEFFAEMELTGAGFAVRGAVFPGVPFVLIGRGPDFAWSATSSQADNVDLFVETLCDDDRHYLYRGQCEPMRRFFVGHAEGAGAARPGGLVLRDAPTGRSSATRRSAGSASRSRCSARHVVASCSRCARSTTSTRVACDSAKDFLSTMNGVEFSFNWFYADDRDIALFSSGRLPIRAAGHRSGAAHDRHRGLRLARLRARSPGTRRAINPPSGAILNWNNRPAANVGAADSNFSYGSVHRIDLLRLAVAGRKKHSLATLTGAMNKAATQDLRAVRVWPVIRAVLQTGSAPSARAEAAAGLLDSWRAAGSSRLDRELDGKIDDPGAAVMDAAWPRLADAVMRPVLGPLVDRLAALHATQRRPGPGWLGAYRRRLVRVRGQGSAHAARTRGARPVLAALLRCRRARVVPRGALGGSRRSGRGARGEAGAGSLDVESGCDGRAHPVHVRRAPRHDALDESTDVPAAHVVPFHRSR